MAPLLSVIASDDPTVVIANIWRFGVHAYFRQPVMPYWSNLAPFPASPIDALPLRVHGAMSSRDPQLLGLFEQSASPHPSSHTVFLDRSHSA